VDGPNADTTNVAVMTGTKHGVAGSDTLDADRAELPGSDPLSLSDADHGAHRLSVLGRVKWPSTVGLLRRLGVHAGMQCLDVGCGSGAVTLGLARMVGPSGHVVGFDHNQAVLRWALDASTRQRVTHATFCTADVCELQTEARYDLVFARFLLSRIADPQDAVQRMVRALRPGGVLVVEDEEHAGQFAYPSQAAFDRYTELYAAAIRARGGDPNVGPRVPGLFDAAGLVGVGVDLVQPALRRGEGKELPALTMAHISRELRGRGITVSDEIEAVTGALERIAIDDTTLVALPRVYQVWGRKPR
jgi:SAM-dependent methyltransferase